MRSSDPVLAAALDLHGRGLCPIPCHIGCLDDGGTRYLCSCGREGCGSPGKHPALPWTPFQTRRATVVQVLDWYTGRFRHYNLGLVHGAAFGTMALDIDGEEGRDSLRVLEVEIGALPDTVTILTGGGGEHRLFRHPGGVVQTMRGLRDGLDVRGDGGFSVCPPSVHVSTRHYEWSLDGHIEEVEFAPLPPRWRELLEQPVEYHSMPPADYAYNTDAKIVDGRESFMLRVVHEAFNDLLGRLQRLPVLDELTNEAWDRYAPKVDLSRPGRGYPELVSKCRTILRRHRDGRIITRLTSPPRF